jgi:hypothetical protein
MRRALHDCLPVQLGTSYSGGIRRYFCARENHNETSHTEAAIHRCYGNSRCADKFLCNIGRSCPSPVPVPVIVTNPATNPVKTSIDQYPRTPVAVDLAGDAQSES